LPVLPASNVSVPQVQVQRSARGEGDAPLQPLPPNTGMSLVVAVPGTTVADDAFWAVECQKIPSMARGITVDMGAVRDFFRPVEGSSFCEMLTSYNKHQWSADGETWVDVAFYGHSVLHNGGSAYGWPRDDGRAGDARTHLSFWGDDGSLTGGCCSSSTAVAHTLPSLPGNGGNTHWGQPFSVSFLYVHLSYEEAMQLANQVQLLNRTVGNLTDDLTAEKALVAAEQGKVVDLTDDLAAEKALVAAEQGKVVGLTDDLAAEKALVVAEQGKVAGLTDDLAAEKALVAAVSDNLTTCSIDLEQRRRDRAGQSDAPFGETGASNRGGIRVALVVGISIPVLIVAAVAAGVSCLRRRDRQRQQATTHARAMQRPDELHVNQAFDRRGAAESDRVYVEADPTQPAKYDAAHANDAAVYAEIQEPSTAVYSAVIDPDVMCTPLADGSATYAAAGRDANSEA